MKKLSKSEKVLRLFEGHLSDKAFALTMADAYSTQRYRNGWLNCVRMLRKRGYMDEDIESILRSKVTRWAADSSSNRYGFHSANDLARYIDENPESIRDLIKFDPTEQVIEIKIVKPKRKKR